MKSVRKLLVVVAFIMATALFSFGTVRYVAQSAGTFSGGSACNGHTTITMATWNGTAESAGDTTYICGTITGAANASGLSIGWSGTSASPISIIFDTGAVMTSPAWSSAIAASSKVSYIVINGGTNGAITNTANGDGLSYQGGGSVVYFANGCVGCTVENLSITHVYMKTSNTSTPGASAVECDGMCTGLTVANNTLANDRAGVYITPDCSAGCDASNLSIHGNTIQDQGWGIAVGGGDAGDTMNNLNIYNNTITGWTNWAQPSSVYHQDGIILFNVGNPSAGLQANIYGNYIYGDLTNGSPTGYIYCADFSSCNVFNNVLVHNANNPIYGLMWLGQSSDMGKTYYVFNNTMIDTSATGSVCIMINSTVAAYVENNICANLGTGSVAGYSTYDGTLASFEGIVKTSNYNDYYANTTGSNWWGSQQSGSQVAYSSWTSAGYEANSITSNPQVNTTTFQLASGSPAISSGTNLTAQCSGGLAPLCQDRAGNARPTSGAWSAGAYQYGGSTPLAPPSNVTASIIN